MNDQINNKIQELFNSTPNEIGVAFGKKTVNGELNGELAFIFTVPKKLPIEEISQNEILPSSIDIEGVNYKTDVLEVGEIRVIACDPNTINNCYGWANGITPDNQNTIRPLKGGIQISSYNNSPNYPTEIIVGTLGFIALDIETSAIVGVSNNHVLIKDAFYTNERTDVSSIEHELDDNVYQSGFDRSPSGTIGKVMRYVPISLTKSNQVDAGLIALYSNVISFSESYKQFGLSISTPMEFATTSEIDSALVGNYPLASSGRSTGVKMGTPCGLIMGALSYISYVSGYHNSGVEINVLYDNLILFTRENPQCTYPIYPGDSGSSLLAFIGGKWKIIGLCFAGGSAVGLACRIDVVASQLGIKPWDGTSKPFIDVNSKQVKAVHGTSGDKTLNCNGRVYWQVGLDNNTNYC